jgi:hypothetical protein
LLRKLKKNAAEEELLVMMIKQKICRTIVFYGDINMRYSANTGGHKYSLRRYYKDYFAIKKRKEETQ